MLGPGDSFRDSEPLPLLDVSSISVTALRRWLGFGTREEMLGGAAELSLDWEREEVGREDSFGVKPPLCANSQVRQRHSMFPRPTRC